MDRQPYRLVTAGRLVEVWESREAADRFVRETLSGVPARAGIPPGPPRIVFPVRTSMQARDRPARRRAQGASAVTAVQTSGCTTAEHGGRA